MCFTQFSLEEDASYVSSFSATKKSNNFLMSKLRLERNFVDSSTTDKEHKESGDVFIVNLVVSPGWT